MDEKKIVDRLSRVGIFGNILLAAFKLFAGIFGKSGAMVSDAVHSLSDVFATLIAWIGVRLSRRAEDAEHPSRAPASGSDGAGSANFQARAEASRFPRCCH